MARRRRIEQDDVVARSAPEYLGRVPPGLAEHRPVVKARRCAEKAMRVSVLEYQTRNRPHLDDELTVLLQRTRRVDQGAPEILSEWHDLVANRRSLEHR